MKTLIQLAKGLDFSNGNEYFDYIRDSYINGNFSQVRRLFKAMSRKDRTACVKYLKPSKEHIDTIDQEVYEYLVEDVLI